MTDQSQRFKTVPQAAHYLNLPERRIYDMIYANEIVSVKIGRLRRIPTEELERWATELIEKQWVGYGQEGQG